MRDRERNSVYNAEVTLRIPRIILIVCLALLIGALVLAVLIFMTHQLTLEARTPAHILPADTVAYAAYPSEADLVRLNTLLGTEVIPRSAATPEAVAVLEQSGALVAVTFVRTEEPQPNTLSFPPFSVTINPPSATPPLKLLQETPLQNEPSFTALAGTQTAQDSWVFIRTTALSPLSLTDRLALALVGTQSESLALFHSANDQITVRGYTREKTEKAEAVSEGPGHHLVGATFSVRAGNLSTVWKRLLSGMTEEEAIITQSIVRRQVRQLFGEKLSLEYDLLPTLHDASIELDTRSTPTILAVQTPLQQNEAEQLLDSMQHTSTDGAIQIEERQVGDFTFRGIGMRESNEQNTNSKEDWYLSGHTENGLPFSVALREDSLVFATADTSVLQLGSGSTFAMPAKLSALGSRLATGLIRPNGLHTWLTTTLPTTESSLLLLPQSDEKYRWSLESNGNITTLQFVPETLGNAGASN